MSSLLTPRPLGVFTGLIKGIGVSGVQVEEIYSIDKETLDDLKYERQWKHPNFPRIWDPCFHRNPSFKLMVLDLHHILSTQTRTWIDIPVQMARP